MEMMKNLKALIVVPALGLALAGCGAVQFNATCSDGHCTGTAGPAVANASVSPSASIPGISPSMTSPPPSTAAPTVTVTQYVDVVQQCLPDPTEDQLTSLADGDIPSCLQIPQGQVQVFITVINNELGQTPRSELHSQQGRDDWRDREVAYAVQQAHQGQ
jgi:hypothetical protein